MSVQQMDGEIEPLSVNYVLTVGGKVGNFRASMPTFAWCFKT
jgi:hypothetical protein